MARRWEGPKAVFDSALDPNLDNFRTVERDESSQLPKPKLIHELVYLVVEEDRVTRKTIKVPFPRIPAHVDLFRCLFYSI